MDGWLVTVAIKEDGDDDDDGYRHITYAVAVANPSKAAKLAMRDSVAKGAVLNRPLEAGMLQSLGLEAGELAVVHDDDIDPITSRPRHH
ncbi:hypothetical protein [Bradyrhizobium sp. 2S1]|uniref:hypothetical protein n=1 Tax=Bradyrhizobium sp. 2S1 TaxID=1404429 RepID=UPI00140AEF91|nr:hypothetical protein [Bradyrhizobium sp. 2S1]MCK7667226.1 hypothetical protein [Bradyrhizobium sp. 2S1]